MGANWSKESTKPKEVKKPSISQDILIYVVVTIIFAVFGFFIIKYCFMDNVAPFVSQYDGQNYEVRKVGDQTNRQTAADYLALINAKVNKLVDYMNLHNLPDSDTAKRLYHRWMSIELKETNSTEKSAAYTLNKSTEIRLCIRDQNGNFEDPNTSMFVILHELAHVMSISYNHTEEFKNNFSYITHLASSLGLYRPEDFIKEPKMYCGTQINTTPCENNSCNFNTVGIKK
jgi:uncharacterized protein YxeA